MKRPQRDSARTNDVDAREDRRMRVLVPRKAWQAGLVHEFRPHLFVMTDRTLVWDEVHVRRFMSGRGCFAMLVIVQDAIFAEPRLARIYDLWEGDRVDLPHYLTIATELGGHSVLDVGCGTGNWACILAERGFEVVGLDPAAASLDVARAKPGAQRVQWIHGDVTSLPTLAVDLATMTGNVSNVFLTQQEWLATLGGVHAALRPSGYLVFESVDPAGQPWLNWNRETTHTRRESPDEGVFESWTEVTRVDGDLVSIRRTYIFAADGATLTSEGIRRYPPRAVIEESLISTGYELTDVRDAPDRPGRELVFIARKPVATS